jgi:hypothetical protein
MSLHSLANHLQSAGRGEDKVLVHMTPREVGGLQALAMAHGGSLTINPQTGLPEAGFLKKLLPTIAGFGLSMIPGVGPLMAAGIVGGGTALATGSLSKGLMAGLGAYGGAGLGAGLAKTGAAAAGAGAGAAGTAGTGASIASQPALSYAGANLGTSAGTAANAANAANIVNQPALSYAGANAGANLAPTISSTAASTAAPSMTSNVLSGVKALGQEGGLGRLYDALPKNTLPALGGALLAGMSDQKGITPQQSKSYIRPYTYERTQRPGVYDMGAPMYASTPGSSAERNYFNDSYTAQTPILAPGPEYAAEGGLMGYAAGGPIEQMAAMNAVGANTGYPMAAVNTPVYANPMIQRPEAVNVIAPSGDAGVSAYSGEPRFAGGGKTVTVAPEGYNTTGNYQYAYDPNTMQFTQTSAPTMKANPIRGIMNKVGAMITGQFNAPVLDTGAKVSGGMAPPAMGPTPAIPAQPAYTPPNIPAYQSPEQQLGLNNFYSSMNKQLAGLQGLRSLQGLGGYDGYAAGGGVSHLGDYSDGGRLLKGPGDGVSDSIPAVIGNRQPARLADGEFVVPARIVSELGNGSTEAGARKLYAMMDRVQKARGKTVGKGKVAANTRSEKHLPA